MLLADVDCNCSPFVLIIFVVGGGIDISGGDATTSNGGTSHGWD
jgi:hypothetical protein